MMNNPKPYALSDFLTTKISYQRYKKLVWISDDARSMGIHVMAGKGSGKSRLMGRLIGWLDFIRGVPQVIFDPHGPTIDNFLDKIIRMPPEIQKKLWPRVLYIDMSGKEGSVIPFPLFYRFGQESLYEISQRYLDVVLKIDPFLKAASIEGWNALWRVGTHSGMILAALGYQISEAEDLILNPQKWQSQLNQAISIYPEIAPSVSYLMNLSQQKEAIRSRKMESYLNKISIFALDNSMKAMFGSSQKGLDWDNVVNQRITVLLDFRHEHDVERRRFKMVWAFNYLMDYVKQRGVGRHQPIGLIIDELTSLFSLQALSSDLFGTEMDELINVLARNYRLWLTIAHQEMFQLADRTFKSLMTMGTQIMGVTTDPLAAKYFSELFFQYRPYWIKKVEAVYASEMGVPFQIDERTVEFSSDEQLLMQSYIFRDQSAFHFMARPAPGEGNIQGKLRTISIANLDKDIYPHPVFVPLARQKLMQRDGIAIEQILREVEDRKVKERLLQDGRSIGNQKKEKSKDIPIWD